jgi:hypothetical protein
MVEDSNGNDMAAERGEDEEEQEEWWYKGSYQKRWRGNAVDVMREDGLGSEGKWS